MFLMCLRPPPIFLRGLWNVDKVDAGLSCLTSYLSRMVGNFIRWTWTRVSTGSWNAVWNAERSREEPPWNGSTVKPWSPQNLVFSNHKGDHPPSTKNGQRLWRDPVPFFCPRMKHQLDLAWICQIDIVFLQMNPHFWSVIVWRKVWRIFLQDDSMDVIQREMVQPQLLLHALYMCNMYLHTCIYNSTFTYACLFASEDTYFKKIRTIYSASRSLRQHYSPYKNGFSNLRPEGFHADFRWSSAVRQLTDRLLKTHSCDDCDTAILQKNRKENSTPSRNTWFGST